MEAYEGRKAEICIPRSSNKVGQIAISKKKAAVINQFPPPLSSP